MPKNVKPDDAAPSIQSVAAYAGVSTATVSKVMQGVATVRPENVKSVQNAIEALGYRINPLAAELRLGRRKAVGVVLPSFEGSSGSLLQALEHQLEDRGVTMTAASSRGSSIREKELIARFEDSRVSGLIVAPIDAEEAASSLRTTVAIVLFGEARSAEAGVDLVAVNWTSVSKRLAADLVSKGHRQVGLLAPVVGDLGAAGLAEAVEAALRSHRELKLMTVRGGEAYEAVPDIRALLTGPPRTTALVSVWHAGGLIPLVEADRLGLRVPEDLSVVALVEGRVPAALLAKLAIIPDQHKALAKAAVNVLFDRIERPTAPPARRLLDGTVDLWNIFPRLQGRRVRGRP